MKACELTSIGNFGGTLKTACLKFVLISEFRFSSKKIDFCSKKAFLGEIVVFEPFVAQKLKKSTTHESI